MRKLFFLIMLSSIVMGCSSSSNTVGKETIVQTAGNSPDWLNAPSNEVDGKIYVTGEASKVKDRSFGMNQAYADGVRKLMDIMVKTVQSQGADAMQGSNMSEGDIGRYSKFVISWISDTYKISGVKNPSSYWEKVEKNNSDGLEYFYNCYSQLVLSKEDYEKAITGAFKAMKEQASKENNKKAEDAAEKGLEHVKNLSVLVK